MALSPHSRRNDLAAPDEPWHSHARGKHAHAETARGQCARKAREGRRVRLCRACVSIVGHPPHGCHTELSLCCRACWRMPVTGIPGARMGDGLVVGCARPCRIRARAVAAIRVPAGVDIRLVDAHKGRHAEVPRHSRAGPCRDAGRLAQSRSGQMDTGDCRMTGHPMPGGPDDHRVVLRSIASCSACRRTCITICRSSPAGLSARGQGA